MLTGMGVASPKYSKSNRKPKKTKYCTIPNSVTIKEREKKKSSNKRNWTDKLKEATQEATIFMMMHKSQV